MSHPRATFPGEVVTFYQTFGGKRTVAAYGTSWLTLRRWLIEHGVAIRAQGLRLGRVGRDASEQLKRERTGVA